MKAPLQDGVGSKPCDVREIALECFLSRNFVLRTGGSRGGGGGGGARSV